MPDRTVRPNEVEGEVTGSAKPARWSTVAGPARPHRQRAGPEESRIFDAQMMMAQDEDFLAGVEALIRNNRLAAETAYEFKALELRNAWQGSRAATCASAWPTSTPSSCACSRI